MSYEKCEISKCAEEEYSPKGGSRRFLYIAACTANITAFCGGISFGWTSPMLPKLLNNTEGNLPEPITLEQASWIGSLLPIGASIGPFIAGIAIDSIGRKKSLLLSIIPIIAAYCINAYANNVLYYYISRFLCGLFVGANCTILPIYVGEIAEDSVRGALGSFMQLFITLGLLFSFCTGPYMDITNYNLMALIPPLIFIFSFVAYIPETPHYYLSKNKLQEAEKALVKLRSSSPDEVRDELAAIKASVDESMNSKGGFSDIFKSPGLMKAFLLSISLVTSQQLSGINVVLFYSQSLFEATGSTIPPERASIIIGVVQVMASFAPPLLADKLGRRALLITSGVFMGIALAPLGYYFHLKDSGGNTEPIFWLPVLCMVVYIIFYCLGFGPLPWAVMGELFPAEVKSAASTVTAFVCWILAFVITKFFASLVAMVGNAGSFWIFSVCSFLSAGFVYKYLPETSGRSLQEIQKILARRR